MDIWALPEERVYDELGTSPKGLNEDEAFKRLSQYGHNTLPAKVGRPIIYRFFDQFTTLFAIMLEAAAVLVFMAAMLSHGSDRQDQINVMVAIIGVVVLNGVIGFFQEYQSREGDGSPAEAGAGECQGRARRRGDDSRRRRPRTRRRHRARRGRQHQCRRPRDPSVRDVDHQHRPHRRVRRGAQDGRPHPRGGACRHQHAEPRLHGHQRGGRHGPGDRLQHRPEH